jgi:hypothetical protein
MLDQLREWIGEFRNLHPLWTDYGIETLSGLTVIAVAAAYAEVRVRWWYKRSLRIGANWTWEGTDPKDNNFIFLHPNINIVSYSNAPRLIIHSVWVRERQDIKKPGQIYGHLNLTDHMGAEKRTTGGDPVNIAGPRIRCKNLKTEVSKVMTCPVWIQTSDNQWFKAQSTGNVEPNFWKRSWPFHGNEPVIKKSESSEG